MVLIIDVSWQAHFLAILLFSWVGCNSPAAPVIVAVDYSFCKEMQTVLLYRTVGVIIVDFVTIDAL